MAIYRAVGQNTYEFVMKTQFSLGVDLTERFHPIGCPIIKYYTTDDSTKIRYAALTPNNKYRYDSSVDQANYTKSSLDRYINWCKADTFNVFGNALREDTEVDSSPYLISGHILPEKGAVVDGETYYGSDAARYEYFWGSQIYSSSISGMKICIMPAKYKIIKYQASTGTIVTEEYNITEEKSFTSSSTTSSSSTSWNYFHYVGMNIPKTADDLILWIETEFPEE